MALAPAIPGPVLALLKEDRRQLVREVFSTFPMNDIPPEHRVLNPYEFYRRFCAKGRFVFLPFVLVWILCRGLGLIARRVMAIVGDVIHPHDRPRKAGEVHCAFSVARRKIHRMRRPVVMECLRMRAHFDVESFGLGLPGRRSTLKDTLAEDLLRVGAEDRQRWVEHAEASVPRERVRRAREEVLRRVRGGAVLV